MILGVDTNVLIYADGFGAPEKTARALRVLKRHAPRIVIPALAIGELYRVLHRKAKLPADRAAAAARQWCEAYDTRGVSTAVLDSALRLAAGHKFHIWDAVAVCCCEDAGCGLFLSEDMQDGFMWRAMRIANPFTMDETRLDALLGG